MSLKSFFYSKTTLWGAYTLLAVLASVQRLAFGFDEKGFSRYENYRIFKYSWHYLSTGNNPYSGNPETWDLYKYSPAFAVAMAPFYALPDWIGLVIWSLFNALPLLAAILVLPRFSEVKRMQLAWLVLPELMICLQNAQSNGLMAALFLGVYIALEREQAFKSAAWAMGSAFIKIFGIFAALLAVFYPRQWLKLGVSMLFWGVFLTVIPAVFIGWNQLEQVYIWWWKLLQEDHQVSVGISVAGWLQTWFGYMPDKFWITTIGGLVMLAAVLWQAIQRRSPLPVLAALLIWVVIFNHKAESPTFIIAMCGAGIWYFSLAKPRMTDTLLLATAFLLASIAPTDLFPRLIYNQWVQPFALKAVPFILIWAALIMDIFRHEQRTHLEIS